MEQGKYYQHSGQFSLGGTILAGLAGALGIAVLACIYAALILYIPLAGYVTFLLSIGFGMGVGFVAGAAMTWGKVRNDTLAFVLSGAFALGALYVSWAAWTWLLLKESDVEAHLMAILPQPAVLWSLVTEINQVGAWSMSGFAPTGGALWLLWGLEAVLILAPAFLLALGMTAIPFCERCERWCDLERDVARTTFCETELLKQGVETGPLAYLTSVGPPAVQHNEWIRADLYTCPSCREMHALSLAAVTQKRGDKGETHETELELVRQLLVSTQEAEGIRSLPA